MKKITRKWLEEMAQVDVKTVDPADLKDIRDVKIDMDLPKEERIRQFIEQIGNPYCYKCGKMIIKLRFNPDGKTLEEKMKDYIEIMNQELY